MFGHGLSHTLDTGGKAKAVSELLASSFQAVDDDMSDEDEDEDEATLAGVAAAARRASRGPEPDDPQRQRSAPMSPAAKPSAATDIVGGAQIADIEMRIAQLQDLKKTRLAEEDYMGAHVVKQMIDEQAAKLKALQTTDYAGIKHKAQTEVAAPPRKAPRVSLSIGPRSPAMSPRTTSRGSGAQCVKPCAPALPVGARLGLGIKGIPAISLQSPSAAKINPPSPQKPSQQQHQLPTLLSGQGRVAPALPLQGRPQASSDQSAAEAGRMSGGSCSGPDPEEQSEMQAEESGEDVGENDLESSQWRRIPRNGSDIVELTAVDDAKEGAFWLDRCIYDRLYPYQRDGVAWMARLWQRHKGGVLADEMGLGKTIQVCALLNGARKSGATHALLLLPVTLLAQWAKEARTWCPGWPVHIYYGGAAQRAQTLRRIRRPEGGLLLTTYSLISNVEELLSIDVDECPSPKKKGRKLLAFGEKRARAGEAKRQRLDDDEGDEYAEFDHEPTEADIPESGLPRIGLSKSWDIVICDEAHKMKNMSTLLGKSLRQLHSKCRLLLTGTPVQNALQDLWSLMDFAQPGLLGNHATFVKTFSDPIDRGSVRGAKVWAVELKKHLAEQLRSIISPHILRRTKLGTGLQGGADDDADQEAAAEAGVEGEATVKKLPPKKETVIWLMPSEEQVSAYQKVLEKSEVIREACQKGKLGLEVFRAIGLLKRLCNHPALVLPTQKAGSWGELLSQAVTDGDPEAGQEEEVALAGDGAEESLTMAGASGQDDARGGRPVEMMLRKLPRSRSALLEQSSKLRCLASLLPALAARGHRTLVFSSSVKMLDLVQICCLKPNGLRCLRIDGQTEPAQRHEKVDKFNREDKRFQCMLLTTTVGGVGLTLTGADRVILVDPAWNPATDAQAVDRAFRIGQTKEVRVYRLIMSGLIEDKMFRLQVFKMGLAKTALESDKVSQNYFTSREIRALFEWTEPSEGETLKLLNEKHGKDSDEAVEKDAQEDGSDEGWLSAGPTAGLSDFTGLYGNLTQADEEEDEDCAAQVAEAKDKLGAADEKLRTAAQARQEAEEKRDQIMKDIQNTADTLQLTAEKRALADEALREARTALTLARREEVAAQQRVEKAGKVQANTQDALNRSQDGAQNMSEMAEAAAAAAQESLSAASASDEASIKALADVELQVGLVGVGGRAVGDGVVDASADKVRKAQRACEKVRSAAEAVLARQGELESLEDELAKAEWAEIEAAVAAAKLEQNPAGEADESAAGSAPAQAAIARKGAELTLKNREKEKQKIEQSHAKAQQKAEAAREAAVGAVAALAEAGAAYAESYQKAQARQDKVKADQVKAAQQATKATLRQLTSVWQALKRSREAWGKALTLKRRAVTKASTAATSEVASSLTQTGAATEYSQAGTAEALRRDRRTAAETDLAAAEAQRTAAEAEDAEGKRRRDELKAALPRAKEEIRLAKVAEKEATQERQSLHAACSKVEKAHVQLEEAKNTALQTLRDEEYDPNQVEQAYEHKRKGDD